MRGPGALLALAFVIFGVVAVWIHFSASCDLWSWGVAADVPARCLSEFGGGK